MWLAIFHVSHETYGANRCQAERFPQMLQFKKLFVEPNARRLLAAGFFLLFLVLGISVYGDYGISCDEKTSRDRNGLPNYQFIAHGDYQAVKGTCEKYHGPAFEILLLF